MCSLSCERPLGECLVRISVLQVSVASALPSRRCSAKICADLGFLIGAQYGAVEVLPSVVLAVGVRRIARRTSAPTVCHCRAAPASPRWPSSFSMFRRPRLRRPPAWRSNGSRDDARCGRAPQPVRRRIEDAPALQRADATGRVPAVSVPSLRHPPAIPACQTIVGSPPYVADGAGSRAVGRDAAVARRSSAFAPCPFPAHQTSSRLPRRSRQLRLRCRALPSRWRQCRRRSPICACLQLHPSARSLLTVTR